MIASTSREKALPRTLESRTATTRTRQKRHRTMPCHPQSNAIMPTIVSLSTSNLLEYLRANPSQWGSQIQQRDKMRLIIRNISSFPSKLRPAIQEAGAWSDMGPEWFLYRFEIAVADFLLGRPVRDDYHARFSYYWHISEWCGLDSRVDTLDQAELCIRCFPRLLNCQKHAIPGNRLFVTCPIFHLAGFPQATSFVPLFAKVGAELEGCFDPCEKGGLLCSRGNVLMQLFRNVLRKRDLDFFRYEQEQQ